MAYDVARSRYAFKNILRRENSPPEQHPHLLFTRPPIATADNRLGDKHGPLHWGESSKRSGPFSRYVCVGAAGPESAGSTTAPSGTSSPGALAAMSSGSRDVVDGENDMSSM